VKKRQLTGLLTLALISIGLSCHTALAAKQTQAAAHQTITPCINRISVSGNILLKLQQSAGKKCYRITFDDKTSNSVRSHVDHHSLFISNDGKPTQITLAIKSFSSLRADNGATITSKRFNDPTQLNVSASNNSAIELKGTFNLNHITQHSTRPIMVEWVKSRSVAIDSHASGRITLAGISDNITAKLHNHSQLDAEYLRANTALIKTSEFATAKVTALNNLRAFAHGHSNIYYYTQPKYITRVATDAANILQLAWHQ
jgi:hypothetical protein